MNEWTTETPTKAGWYFWRMDLNQNIVWLWDVVFLLPPDESYEHQQIMVPGREYGMSITDWPGYGVWKLIELEID